MNTSLAIPSIDETIQKARENNPKAQAILRDLYAKINHWNMYWMIHSRMEKFLGPEYYVPYLNDAKCIENIPTIYAIPVIELAREDATTAFLRQILGRQDIPAGPTGVRGANAFFMPDSDK